MKYVTAKNLVYFACKLIRSYSYFLNLLAYDHNNLASLNKGTMRSFSNVWLENVLGGNRYIFNEFFEKNYERKDVLQKGKVYVV